MLIKQRYMRGMVVNPRTNNRWYLLGLRFPASRTWLFGIGLGLAYVYLGSPLILAGHRVRIHRFGAMATGT